MSEHASGKEVPPITQAELRPFVEAVRQYGEAHPGVLEQIWYEGPPERVVALLAGDDTATHEAALRALVNSPEYLEIKRSGWPPGHLERVRQEITESAQGSISSIGLGKGVLGVGLRADQVDVAETLHDRYGDAVVLTVGYFPYPDIKSGNAINFDSHGERPDYPALPDEVSLLLARDIEIRSGSHVRSTLTIRNRTGVELVAGKLIPPIVDPASGLVVGGYNGAMTMEGRRDQIAAGDSKEVPILIGTASTNPTLATLYHLGLGPSKSISSSEKEDSNEIFRLRFCREAICPKGRPVPAH